MQRWDREAWIDGDGGDGGLVQQGSCSVRRSQRRWWWEQWFQRRVVVVVARERTVCGGVGDVGHDDVVDGGAVVAVVNAAAARENHGAAAVAVAAAAGEVGDVADAVVASWGDAGHDAPDEHDGDRWCLELGTASRTRPRPRRDAGVASLARQQTRHRDHDAVGAAPRDARKSTRRPLHRWRMNRAPPYAGTRTPQSRTQRNVCARGRARANEAGGRVTVEQARQIGRYNGKYLGQEWPAGGANPHNDDRYVSLPLYTQPRQTRKAPERREGDARERASQQTNEGMKQRRNEWRTRRSVEQISSLE